MDVGLVSIDFVGVADPLLAEIARVRESLTGLTRQVVTNVGEVAAAAETKYTSTVKAESEKRASTRKKEALTLDAQLAEWNTKYEASVKKREATGAISEQRASFALSAELDKRLRSQGAFLKQSERDYDVYLANLKAKMAATQAAIVAPIRQRFNVPGQKTSLGVFGIDEAEIAKANADIVRSTEAATLEIERNIDKRLKAQLIATEVNEKAFDASWARMAEKSALGQRGLAPFAAAEIIAQKARATAIEQAAVSASRVSPFASEFQDAWRENAKVTAVAAEKISATQGSLTAKIEEENLKQIASFEAVGVAATKTAEKIAVADRVPLSMSNPAVRARMASMGGGTGNVEQDAIALEDAKYDALVAKREANKAKTQAAEIRAGIRKPPVPPSFGQKWFPGLFREDNEVNRYQAFRGINNVMRGAGGFGVENPMSSAFSGGAGMLGQMAAFPALVGGQAAYAAVGGAVAGTGSLVWLHEVLKYGGEYQKTVANMGAQTNLTKEQTDAFALSGRKLAMTFGKDAKDNVDGMRLLINAFGLDLAKNEPAVTSMMETANKFAIAGNIELPEAVSTLITSYNSLGYSIHGPGGVAQAMKDINDLANFQANAFTQGQVQADRMNASLQKVGAIATESGVHVKDLLAMIETAGKSQLTGQQIGTGIRNMLLGLSSNKAAKSMIAAGINPNEVNPLMTGNADQAISALMAKLTALHDKGKEGAVQVEEIEQKVSGVRQVAVMEFLRTNMDVFHKIQDQLGKTDDLARMYAENADTVTNREQRLEQKLKDLFLGSFGKEAFDKVLDDLGEFANKLVASEPAMAKLTSEMLSVLDLLIKGVNLAYSLAHPFKGLVTQEGADKVFSVNPFDFSNSGGRGYRPGGKVDPFDFSGFGDFSPAQKSIEVPAGAGIGVEWMNPDRKRKFPFGIPQLDINDLIPPSTKKVKQIDLDDTGGGGSGSKKSKAEIAADNAAESSYIKSISALTPQVDDLTDEELREKKQQIEIEYAKKKLAIEKQFGKQGLAEQKEIATEELRIATEVSDAKVKETEKSAKANEKLLKLETEYLSAKSDLFAASLAKEDALKERSVLTVQAVHEEIEDRNNARIKDDTQRAVAEANTRFQRDIDSLEKKIHDSDTTSDERKAYFDDEDSLRKQHAENLATIEQDAAKKAVQANNDIANSLREVGGALQGNVSNWENWGNVIGVVLGAMLNNFLHSNSAVKSGLSGSGLSGSSGYANMFPYQAPKISPLPSRESNPLSDIKPHKYLNQINGMLPFGSQFFTNPDVLTPHSDGGFTGQGGKYEPAGIVHRGEFVWDADTVSKVGVQNISDWYKSLRGYDVGGPVGMNVQPSDVFGYANLAGSLMNAVQPQPYITSPGNSMLPHILGIKSDKGLKSFNKILGGFSSVVGNMASVATPEGALHMLGQHMSSDSAQIRPYQQNTEEKSGMLTYGAMQSLLAEMKAMHQTVAKPNYVSILDQNKQSLSSSQYQTTENWRSSN